jgi:hypothetical protein
MIFNILWDFVLPLAAWKYRAIRIFQWMLLVSAAGLTFYYF